MDYQPIQRILVPLDTSGYSQAAALRACEVARAHSARVSGLAVLDMPEIAGSIPPGELTYWPIIHDTVENLAADARDRLSGARERFATICESERVGHSENELEGVPASRILEASALYDLIVMGLRTFFHFETREGPGDSLSQVLGRTVTPVLAVPQETGEGEVEPFRRAVVAYDGSFGAARSLREFVAFAAPYEMEITVVTASDDERHASMLLRNASSFLKSHGLGEPETVHLSDPNLSDSGESVLEDADLVVTGIHARQFFKDLFVGSFTDAMIERGDTALFMSH